MRKPTIGPALRTLQTLLLLGLMFLPRLHAVERWRDDRPVRQERRPHATSSVIPLVTGGSITGRVLDSKGAPLAGMALLATPDDVNYFFPDNYADSDANGQYHFSNLPAGQYFVNAYDYQGNQYVDTWYPDVWDTDFHRNLAPATAIAVTDGGTGTADFHLAIGARILLSLKDAAGAPVLAPYSGSRNGCWGTMFADFQGRAIAINGTCGGGRDFRNGTYEPYVVPIGRTYYLEGWPVGLNFQPVFYNQKPTLQTATPITLSAPGPLPITITLGATGHSLSGKFSFATAPNAITGANINLYATDGTFLQTTLANSDLSFQFTGVPDGLYVVRVSVGVTRGTVNSIERKYYSNAATFTSATQIRIAGADVGSINVVVDTPADTPSVSTNTKAISLIAPAGSTSEPSSLAIWTDTGSVNWTAAGTSPWLRVSPASGSVSANQGASLLNVTADATTLAAGKYQDTLTITGNSGTPLRIPVSLDVAAVGAVPNKPLAASLSTLTFQGQTSQFSPQTVTVTNPADTVVSWDLRSRLAEAYPSSGVLNPGASTQVAVAANILDVAFGSVTGLLELRTNGRVTATLPVSVNVAPPATPATRAPLPPPPVNLPNIHGGVSTEAVDVQLARVVPTAASNLAGSTGSAWSSDVFLTNLPSKLASNMTSFTLTPFGNPNGSGSTNIRGLVKAPMTTLASPIATMFLQNSGYGALDIRPEGGALATWARVWTAGRDGKGTYGQDIPAYDSASVIAPGEIGILPVLLGGDGFRTNLQLSEVRGAAVTIHLIVRDSSGNEKSSRDITLSPYEQRTLQRFLPPGLTIGYGEIRVLGGGAAGALVSLIDNTTNDPTTVMVTKRPALTSTGKLIVPGVIRGDGALDTAWRSDVWIVNSGSTALTFAPVLYAAGSAPRTAPTQSIGAHVQAVLHDPLQNLFGLSNGSGALLLDVKSGDASAIRMISRTFTVDATGGTLGQGIQPARDTDEARNGDPGLALFGIARNRNFRTNLQLQETTGSPVTVEVSATGIAANSTSVSLTSTKTNFNVPAFGFVQVPDILGGLGFTDEVTNPRITVRVISGTGSIVTYASMIDSTTGDATTVPSFRLLQ